MPASREGKVYVDFGQNGHGKLIVAPYSVRPLPGATVSTPLAWTEVNATQLLDRSHFYGAYDTCLGVTLQGGGLANAGQTAEDVRNLLWGLNEEHGQTMVIVTHDAKLASEADRVVHLHEGRIDEDRAADLVQEVEL